MAAFETTMTHTGGVFGGRLSDAMRNIVATVVAWNDARETRLALSKLTDRELDDIGLCRADINTL